MSPESSGLEGRRDQPSAAASPSLVSERRRAAEANRDRADQLVLPDLFKTHTHFTPPRVLK